MENATFYEIDGFTKAIQGVYKNLLTDLKDGPGQLPQIIEAKAVKVLRSAVEDFLTYLLMDSMRAMEHAKRKTPMVSALILSIRLRGYNEFILKYWEPLESSINRKRGPTRKLIRGDVSEKLWSYHSKYFVPDYFWNQMSYCATLISLIVG